MWDTTWVWVLLSFGIGASAGLSEIASRYRDEPFRAVANRYGLSYLTQTDWHPPPPTGFYSAIRKRSSIPSRTTL